MLIPTKNMIFSSHSGNGNSLLLGFRPEFECDVRNINVGNYSTLDAEECHVMVYQNESGVVTSDKLPCTTGYQYSAHEDISFVTEVCIAPVSVLGRAR